MIKHLAGTLNLVIEPTHGNFARSQDLVAYYDEFELTVKIEKILPEITEDVISQIVEMLKTKEHHKA